MPEAHNPKRLPLSGEVYPLQKSVPWPIEFAKTQKARWLGSAALLGTAGWCFNQYTQLGGVSSMIASQLFLGVTTLALMIWAWGLAANLPKFSKTCQWFFPSTVLLGSIAIYHVMPPKKSSLPTPPPTNISSLSEADRLASAYRTAHPGQSDLNGERDWVNEKLRREGLPPQQEYALAPWGYVPVSPQCPGGMTHIDNSSATNGTIGFDIEHDPCLSMNNDHSDHNSTGFKVR
jgi:hypothetical protein